MEVSSISREKAPPCFYERALKTPLYGHYHVKRYRVVADIVASHGLEPLLDVGCHAGVSTYFIKKYTGFNEVYGIDIDEEAIKYASTRYRDIGFIVADATSLPFKDNSVGTITCINVFEHLKDPYPALREFYRVLRRNGLVVIVVPNFKSPVFKLLWSIWSRIGWGRVWRNYYFNEIGVEDLVSKMYRTGFSVEKIFTYNYSTLILVYGFKWR